MAYLKDVLRLSVHSDSSIWPIFLMRRTVKNSVLVLADYLARSRVFVARILTDRKTVRCRRIWLGFCLRCRSLHRLWSRQGLRWICELSVRFCVFGPLVRVLHLKTVCHLLNLLFCSDKCFDKHGSKLIGRYDDGNIRYFPGFAIKIICEIFHDVG